MHFTTVLTIFFSLTSPLTELPKMNRWMYMFTIGTQIRKYSVTRYLPSEFLGHCAADNLLCKFKEATNILDPSKIIQVSTDRPNINLKFHRDPTADWWNEHPAALSTLEFGLLQPSCHSRCIENWCKCYWLENGLLPKITILFVFQLPSKTKITQE